MERRTTPACDARAVIFDGDDTLWNTEQLYDDARAMARTVVELSGLDGARWEELERLIDVENVATLGYSVERFPSSCVQAYRKICALEEKTPDMIVENQIRRAAESVFERDPQTFSGARNLLSAIRARGIRTALLTKGDRKVQKRRIERSGLIDLFDVIEVVEEKSPEVIARVVHSLGGDVECAWMVGNSVRSDVLPAIAAGLKAVWINAHVWEYERAHDHLVDDRVIKVSSLPEILQVIPR